VSKAKLAIALSTLSLVATIAWAIPGRGVAHQRVQRPEGARVISTTVAPIRLRDERERGLLATGWINGAGPFVFAIDTGAGVSLISRNVVGQAKLGVTRSRRPIVGGLSTSPISSNEETSISGLALGDRGNSIPGSFNAAVVANLPGSIDGVLDPTEVFEPFGYSVDLPNRQLWVFDSTAPRLRLSDVPPEGAVVRWVRQPGNHRPFVRFEDGRLALLDTGSSFGLALNSERYVGEARQNTIHDLGGGRVQSYQVAPQKVSIGSLVLNGVPTDVLTGVAPGTPIILGRRALFPFRITFDPAAKLISFEPTERD
jgi:hypothetical protein